MICVIDCSSMPLSSPGTESITWRTTIVGLRAVKEAVRIYNPINHKPQNMQVTQELKLSVLCTCCISGKTREKKPFEARRMKEEADRIENDKSKLLETKQLLCKSEEALA